MTIMYLSVTSAPKYHNVMDTCFRKAATINKLSLIVVRFVALFLNLVQEIQSDLWITILNKTYVMIHFGFVRIGHKTVWYWRLLLTFADPKTENNFLSPFLYQKTQY